jgi:hypothetical protein
VQQQVVNATGEPLTPQEQGELDFAAQLTHSDTHKARLLHYFPKGHAAAAQQQAEAQQAEGEEEDWCGWHLDHGSLTGVRSRSVVERACRIPTRRRPC